MTFFTTLRHYPVKEWSCQEEKNRDMNYLQIFFYIQARPQYVPDLGGYATIYTSFRLWKGLIEEESAKIA